MPHTGLTNVPAGHRDDGVRRQRGRRPRRFVRRHTRVRVGCDRRGRIDSAAQDREHADHRHQRDFGRRLRARIGAGRALADVRAALPSTPRMRIRSRNRSALRRLAISSTCVARARKRALERILVALSLRRDQHDRTRIGRVGEPDAEAPGEEARLVGRRRGAQHAQRRCARCTDE